MRMSKCDNWIRIVHCVLSRHLGSCMDGIRVNGNIIALRSRFRIHLVKLVSNRLSLCKTFDFPSHEKCVWQFNEYTILGCINTSSTKYDTYFEFDIASEQIVKRQLPIANFKVSVCYSLHKNGCAKCQARFALWFLALTSASKQRHVFGR